MSLRPSWAPPSVPTMTRPTSGQRISRTIEMADALGMQLYIHELDEWIAYVMGEADRPGPKPHPHP